MTRSVLLSTMRLQMKQSLIRPMFRFCLIANPILNTILLYEMYRNSGEQNFFAYVALGAGLMAVWGCICFSSAGDINRERYSGTLALIFAAPAGFPAIIFGKIIGNTLLSLTSVVISVTTAVLLFRVPAHLGSPGYFIVALMAAILAFVVISSVIACLLTLSRKTELYMNCIEIPVILLCGFVYPVDALPAWLQPVSFVLSPSWAVELLRMSVWGVKTPLLFWKKLAVLLVLTVIYALLSAGLFRCIDRQVRIRAALEVS
ncbi:MAG: ABC transporter permease [Lachnospiraceae bacterium]